MSTKTTFKAESLVAVVDVRDDLLTIVLEGISDGRNPNIFFENMMTAIGFQIGERKIEIDLRGLEYMNSGTVAAIVNMTRGLDAKGVTTLLKYDSSINWQRTNARCMKAIARSLKHLRVDG
jgi:hypothetical protein